MLLLIFFLSHIAIHLGTFFLKPFWSFACILWFPTLYLYKFEFVCMYVCVYFMCFLPVVIVFFLILVVCFFLFAYFFLKKKEEAGMGLDWWKHGEDWGRSGKGEAVIDICCINFQ